MISNLPVAIREHLKGQVDRASKKYQNKNINTVPILFGIYCKGLEGCTGETLVGYFPMALQLAANRTEPFRTMFPGIARMLTSKLVSLESLGLIELRGVEVDDEIEHRFFLTDLGKETLAAVTMTSTVMDESDNHPVSVKTRELADLIINPLMTETVFVRHFSNGANNEWHAMASLVDRVITCTSSMTPHRRGHAVLGVANSMLNSGQFNLCNGVIETFAELNELLTQAPEPMEQVYKA